MHTNQTKKYGMVGSVVIRADTVKRYKKSENKWHKEIKYTKKQNKMLYIIDKKSGSRREIKKIKKIQAKSSKKGVHSSSNDFSDKSDSDSSLASDSS